jgi:hypothetical protein
MLNRLLLISFCFVCIQLQAQKDPVKVDTIKIEKAAVFVCEWYKISLLDLANEGYTLVGPLKDTLFECDLRLVSVDKNYKRYFKITATGVKKGKKVVSTNYLMKNYKEYVNWGFADFMFDEIGTIEITKTRKYRPAEKIE